MKKEQPQNGNMANSLEELEELGKQMDQMKTEQELEAEGRAPDPEQFDND